VSRFYLFSRRQRSGAGALVLFLAGVLWLRFHKHEHSSSDVEDGIVLDTVKLIADLAAKEYANENDIQKSLDAKTATWIAATGAIIIFTIGTLGKVPTITAVGARHVEFVRIYSLEVIFAIMFLIAAEIFFIRAFTVRVFRSMAVNDWTRYESAQLDPIDAYIELAGEYNQAIQANRNISRDKALYQKSGVEYCFLPAMAILAIVLFLTLGASW